MIETTQAVRRATIAGLESAVHRGKALSKAGLLERLFTLAFRGLVYPQIWEDPVVDMAALAIGPNDHIVTIASGGCNVLSYLTANPARITAVDLNGAHVALGHLKLCALEHLPDYESFLTFFGNAASPANLDAYRRHLLPRLDPATAAYWNGRRSNGRRRIEAFARNFYRYGLLGTFIGSGHWLGRLYGCDPAAILTAQSIEEQRTIFQAKIAPIFDKGFALWLSRQPASLFGLGIPPEQYHKLAADRPGGIAAVLRHRLERLACGFDVSQNYFAWQAFGRRYATGSDDALPPYLQRRHFATIRERAGRVTFRQTSMTDLLCAQPASSVDCVVLLDAQDWMSDADLTALWIEITRAARPGARVIFRTAADERLLPGRIPADLLAAWRTDEAECRAHNLADRSSIYGGFHLYRLADARVSDVASPDAGRLMDHIYARQRHIYDASRKYYLLGRDSLIADLAPPPGARVLEIGCGTGRNLIKIARAYPKSRCHGVDISAAMLATARASLTRAGLAPRIALAQGDATSFDPEPLFGIASFDRIVISYALSMIPAWHAVLRHAATLLAPDGVLHIVDFGDQAGLPAAFRRLLAAWLARFHVVPRETLIAEVAALAREHGLAVSSRSLYHGYAVAARLERPR